MAGGARRANLAGVIRAWGLGHPARYRTLALEKGQHPVDLDAAEFLHQAGRPTYFHRGGREQTQPKVQAWVVGGKIAALTQQFLHLNLVPIAHHDPRSDAVAITLRPLKPYLQPVIAARRIVAEE